ncbi:TIGR01906 family membrane protein [Streptococcus caballi]|uniref:TIGR01906 family membrane protein n=1 Tax=Streptococcus caballi TaxID=439220 RepID=UPI00035DEDF8|nr:TIGR01906 family membrane protein [Streptococcus caballi]
MKIRWWTFTTWLWLLSVAVLLTIYLAWFIYPLEVSYLGLEKVVFLTKKTILSNFNILMNYLTNPFAHRLSLPAFHSSKSGLKHFADVKHLFHLAQAVFVLLSLPTWRFLKNSRAEKSLFLHQRVFITAALAPIIIGLAALLTGFDTFFTLFHQVLFPGDSSWLFNPATDPVIWILPEEFFLHCFLVFFVIYELIMLILVFKGKRELKQRLRAKEDSQ